MPLPNYGPHDDEIVQQLLRLVYASPHHERASALLPDGTFTAPANTRTSRDSSSSFSVELPANFEALLHNHPIGSSNDWFSPEDVSIADSLGRPSYIAASQRDQQPPIIRRYTPGVTATRPYPGLRERGSRGDPVTTLLPYEVLIRAIQQELSK